MAANVYRRRAIETCVKRASAQFPVLWGAAFAAIDRLGMPRGEGAVLCLSPDEVPIDDLVTALPLGAV